MPEKPPPDWQCLRCQLILARQPADEIPEHFRTCEFRDTGRDPEPVSEEEQSGGR